MQIARFALIKVGPGLFNIVLIPYLVAQLGAETYGSYSLWLSYAMLVATISGAVVTQPMYRYLSSRPEDLAFFTSFTLVMAALAGGIGLGLSLGLGAPLLLAAGYGAFSAGTVFSAAVAVRLQIARRIGRLACYEALRVSTILVPVAWPAVTGQPLEIGHVVLGMALSNLVPLLLLGGRPGFRLPEGDLLKRASLYGVKSAAWLLLAGVPIVGAKTVLSGTLPEDAFGAYSAIADITYRGFGMMNAAVTMWVFPLLSQRYDEGAFAEVRHSLRFALLVYAGAGGLVLLVGAGIVLGLEPATLGALPGGLTVMACITLANFAWQGMSIAHKPFELTIQTTRMVLLIAIGAAAFLVVSALAGGMAPTESLYAVNVTLVVIACLYAAVALAQPLQKQG